MSMQEICLLNDSFPPEIDGVANVVVNYGRELKGSPYSPCVVTPEYPGADDSAWDYPVLRYPSIDLREQLGYTAGVPFVPRVVESIGRRDIALLHSHCPMASTYLARALREELHVPLVMTYHTKYDIDIANAVRSKALQAGAIKALVENVSAADELWVVSRGAGENIRSLGYTGDYVVMENGVDIPKQRAADAAVAALRAEHGLNTDIPVFLFVGRMMWYKGLRIILDALAALKSQQIPFRMVIIGSGGDENDIKRYASEIGVADSCIFTGAIRDREALITWYTLADLFLFPSTFDTNGLVVREAAACSLASVLVRGSCAAEGVTGGRNGFLIDENAASLAACLARLTDRRETMRTVGENAAAELYLSWHDAVARAADRYGTVIENYRSGRRSQSRTAASEMITLMADVLELHRRAEARRHALGEHLEHYL